jgi:hypothetical protein
MLGHLRGHKQRAYQLEAEAKALSFRRMCDLGVPVPRKSRARARAYMARKKAHDDAIRRAGRLRKEKKP